MSNPYRPDPNESTSYPADPYVAEPTTYPAADPYTTEPVATDYEPVPPADPFPGSVVGDTGYAPSTDYAVTETDSGSGSTGSTTDVAKGEASAVKDTAVEAATNVAGTAKDEAANVAAEAGAQAKSLLGSAGSELKTQVGTQQNRIANTLQSYSSELRGMAQGSSESGPLTDLAHQAAQKVSEIGSWLENREPADVLDEVRSFARRRPMMFLGLCALAGIAAGRVTRGAVAANTSVDSGNSNSSSASFASPAPASAAPVVAPGPAYVEPTYGSYTDVPATGETAGWTDPAQPQSEFGGTIR